MKQVFIVGVEGSGTTMLSRILGYGVNTAVVLGNHLSPIVEIDAETNKLWRRINENTRLLWDIQSGLDEREKSKQKIKKSISEIENRLASEFGIDITVYKRSSPFLHGNRYIPDLLDIKDIFSNSKRIVMVRDPKQSSYSALRRGFLKDIKECGIVCHINLSVLASGIRSDNDVMLIDYHEFCSNPEVITKRLANFLDVDEEPLQLQVEKEKLTTQNLDKYKKHLSSKELDFLNEFFSKERVRGYGIILDRDVENE